MPMDPLTASLIAAGVSASIPYVVEGGKYLFSGDAFQDIGDAFGGGNPMQMSMSAQNQEEDELFKQGLADYTRQISDLEGSVGSALGASLAAGQGSGLSGMSGINFMRGLQGEAAIQGQVGNLQTAMQNLRTQRAGDIRQRAQGNITAALTANESKTARRKAFEDLAGAATTDAERELYTNAGAMYG